jgi:hypothetical protein
MATANKKNQPAARKQAAKSAAKPRKPTKAAFKSALKKSPEIRIRIDIPDGLSSYYVNHLELGYSLYEFALNAAKAPTILSKEARAEAEATLELVVEPELQLVFPPRTAKALVGVLERQIAAYEARFGEIPTTGAKNG